MVIDKSKTKSTTSMEAALARLERVEHTLHRVEEQLNRAVPGADAFRADVRSLQRYAKEDAVVLGTGPTARDVDNFALEMGAQVQGLARGSRFQLESPEHLLPPEPLLAEVPEGEPRVRFRVYPEQGFVEVFDAKDVDGAAVMSFPMEHFEASDFARLQQAALGVDGLSVADLAHDALGSLEQLESLEARGALARCEVDGEWKWTDRFSTAMGAAALAAITYQAVTHQVISPESLNNPVFVPGGLAVVGAMLGLHWSTPATGVQKAQLVAKVLTQVAAMALFGAAVTRGEPVELGAALVMLGVFVVSAALAPIERRWVERRLESVEAEHADNVGNLELHLNAALAADDADAGHRLEDAPPQRDHDAGSAEPREQRLWG